MTEPVSVDIGGLTRVLATGFLALCIAGCLGMMAFIPAMEAPLWLDLVMELIVLLCVLGLAHAVKWVFAYRTTFHPDRVVAVRGFRTVELARNRIKGYRRDADDDGIKLEPLDADLKPFTIHKALPPKAFVDAWLEGLVDLDRRDLEVEREAAEADPRFGATPRERRARYQRLGKIGATLQLAGFVVGFWAALWPEPYGLPLILVALFPFAAIFANRLSNGLLSLALTKQEGDPRPRIGVFAHCAGPALLLRTAADISLVDWRPLAEWSALGGVAFVALFAMLDERPRPMLLVTFVCFAAYCYGLLAEIDRRFDTAPTRAFPVTVLEKNTGDDSYSVLVSGWETKPEGESLNVERAFYDRAEKGATLCIVQGKGRLGFRWYELQFCR